MTYRLCVCAITCLLVLSPASQNRDRYLRTIVLSGGQSAVQEATVDLVLSACMAQRPAELAWYAQNEELKQQEKQESSSVSDSKEAKQAAAVPSPAASSVSASSASSANTTAASSSSPSSSSSKSDVSTPSPAPTKRLFSSSPACQRSSVLSLLCCLLDMLPSVKVEYKTYSPYFMLLNGLALLGYVKRIEIGPCKLLVVSSRLSHGLTILATAL